MILSERAFAHAEFNLAGLCAPELDERDDRDADADAHEAGADVVIYRH
jgi:hypothetical protein